MLEFGGEDIEDGPEKGMGVECAGVCFIMREQRGSLVLGVRDEVPHVA
jgi:hypothetical protein